MGSWGGEDTQQDSGWRTRQSHNCMRMNRKNNWGARQIAQPGVLVQGNKTSKPLTEKICAGCGGGRNCQPHRRVRWRDQPGPRMYTTLPTWESAPEGPNLLVGSGGSD